MAATLLLLALVSAPPDLGITLAPDQPIAEVYLDEPLVVEFLSQGALSGEPEITIFDPARTEHTRRPGAIVLEPGQPYWIAIDGLPPLLGSFAVTVRWPGRPDWMGYFCRVPRPQMSEPGTSTLWAAVDGAATDQIHALRSIPFGGVYGALPANAQGELAEAGLQLAVPISITVGGIGGLTGGENGRPNTQSAIWAGSELIDWFFLQSRRSLTVEAFAVQWEAGPSAFDVRAAAARNGAENLRLVASIGTDAFSPSSYFEALAAGYDDVLIPARAIYARGEVQPGFGIAFGLARALAGVHYLDTLVLSDTARACIFWRERKDASAPQPWLAALYSSDESEHAVLAVGDAVNLRMTDAYGNALTAPEPEDGSVGLAVDGRPIFLYGEGGGVTGAAALGRVARDAGRVDSKQAAAFGLEAEFTKALPAWNGIEAVASKRFELLTVLRAFPELEIRWHGGNVPSHQATEFIASLSRLVRSVAILEQEAGEPFLEPLGETMDRCEEYLALYATATGAKDPNRIRGDWLAREVRRLMDEARMLHEAGRPIESAGVAALAEWRARSLDATLKAAPLQRPPANE